MICSVCKQEIVVLEGGVTECGCTPKEDRVTDINLAIQEAEVTAGQEDEHSLALLASAESFAIATTEQYEESGNLLRMIKARQSHLNNMRLSVTRPMDEAKARVMGLFKPAAERLAKAETAIKGAMLSFTKEQERQRREAQAKLDETARLERERVERQAQRERERLQRLAEANRQKGNEERAAAQEERAAAVEAPIVTAPVIPVVPVRAEGIARRTTWRAEVTDLAALARACLAGEQPMSFIQPNMSLLGTFARDQKDKLSIPGVQAVSEDIIAARS